MMFLFSARFGALADRHGPRFFMGVGPLVAAAGLALFLRIDADVNYVTDLLPGLLVFALGLSMTVAPLTATVLADADESNAGIASGMNNAIARVAGLIAIAAVGALVSSSLRRLAAPAARPGREPAGREPRDRQGGAAAARARRGDQGATGGAPAARAGIAQTRRSTHSISRSASRRCWWPWRRCSGWRGS